MSCRTLVTGGAGFLGSHLCERLLSEGHEVICLDNFGSGQQDNIAEFEDHSAFTVADRDVRIPGSLPSVDRIYHLASRASPADFTDFSGQYCVGEYAGDAAITGPRTGVRCADSFCQHERSVR